MHLHVFAGYSEVHHDVHVQRLKCVTRGITGM